MVMFVPTSIVKRVKIVVGYIYIVCGQAEIWLDIIVKCVDSQDNGYILPECVDIVFEYTSRVCGHTG